MRSSTGWRIGRNLYVLRSVFINRKKILLRLILRSIVWKIICIIKRWLDGVARWPFLRYVVLICDTHMVCVWPSIVLFLQLFILLWSRKMIVRQQGSLSGSRPCLRNCQSCRRHRSLPFQIEGGSNLFLTEIPPLREIQTHSWYRFWEDFCPTGKGYFCTGLQLLPRWESSLCSGNAFQKGKLRLKTNADPTDVIVPVPALQKQATDSLHRCDRRDNRTWLAPFRQIEITLIYWIRETFQFPDDLKIRY